MDYRDYKLLAVDDRAAGKPRRNTLIEQGWKEWIRVPWHGLCGGVVIMRRPKDQPRMWTKTEIEEVAKGTKGSVLNERVMQADLCGRLERRNAELQIGVDAVVGILRSQNPGIQKDRSRYALRSIRTHLCPLATKKEESNG